MMEGAAASPVSPLRFRSLPMALLLLLLGGAAGASGLPAAAPLGFTAKVDPSTVDLGRPFVYEIEVRHHPGERYELPRPVGLGTAAVRDVSVEREDEREASVTRIRIEAAVYDQLGEATLPDLILTMTGEGGPKELRIPGAPVTIAVASDSDQLEDIRPPRDLVVRSYTILWILLLLGAAALIAWYLHRREAARKASRPPAPEPKIDADVRALDLLRRLEVEGLAAQGKTREHYFRLSEIVRLYFDDALGITAPEMTSSELVAALWERRPRGLDLPRFEAWSERGNLARFAKVEVSAAEAMADLDEARKMIRSVAAALRLEGKAPQAAASPGGPRGDAESEAGRAEKVARDTASLRDAAPKRSAGEGEP